MAHESLLNCEYLLLFNVEVVGFYNHLKASSLFACLYFFRIQMPDILLSLSLSLSHVGSISSSIKVQKTSLPYRRRRRHRRLISLLTQDICAKVGPFWHCRVAMARETALAMGFSPSHSLSRSLLSTRSKTLFRRSTTAATAHELLHCQVNQQAHKTNL